MSAKVQASKETLEQNEKILTEKDEKIHDLESQIQSLRIK